MFEKAYNLYNLFWALNLKMVDSETMKDKGIISNETIKSIKAEERGSYGSSSEPNIKIEDKSFMSKISGALKKAIDCCKE
jgi:hypothetical protein